MNLTKYLIINCRGGVTVRENEPRHLTEKEIALRLSLQVPDTLFRRPVLEAKMVVPNEAVPASKITPAITDNIEKIVKEATGLNLHVSIVDQPEEK